MQCRSARLACAFLMFALPSVASAEKQEIPPGDTEGDDPGRRGPPSDAGAEAKKKEEEAKTKAQEEAAAACRYQILDGAYKDAAEDLKDLGVDVEEKNLRVTKRHGNKLVLVFNPDGTLRGRVPTVREDSEIFAVIYRSSGANEYDFEVSGCKAPTTRILGEKTEKDASSDLAANVADAHDVGTCSADSPVTIKIGVPKQTSCSARSESTTVSTSAVYRFAVAAAGTVYIGKEFDISLSSGVGGMQRTVTEEKVWSPPAVRLLLGWYPLGYAPSDGLSIRHFMLGTLIDGDDPLDSANIAVGLPLVEGVNVFLGVEPCRNVTRLSRDLASGDVFEDAQDKIPKDKEFSCQPRGYFGLAATTDLVGRLFGK